MSDGNKMDQPVVSSTPEPAAPLAVPGSQGLASQGRVKLVGVLLEHGKANFNFDKDEKENYYVKYRDDRGLDQITWGVDLERALKKSKAEIGQRVELENLGPEAVVVTANVRDGSGHVIGTQKIDTHRNKWRAKTDLSPSEQANGKTARALTRGEDESREPLAANQGPNAEMLARRANTGENVPAAKSTNQQPAKPVRASRKRVPKEVTLPAVDMALGTAASEHAVLAITAESAPSVAYERREPDTPLKFMPEIPASVRYHYNLMQRVEASSRMTDAYLLANARPVGPANQNFIDTLILKTASKLTSAKEPGVLEGAVSKRARSFSKTAESYAPHSAAAAAYRQIDVRFLTLGRLAKEPEQAAFEVQEVENSIEPSHVRKVVTDYQSVQLGSTIPARPTDSLRAGRNSIGKGLLRSMGSAAQKAGIWLSDLGTQSRPAVPVVKGALAARKVEHPPAVPVRHADDKLLIVPVEVARRYLKVDQDYYFHDRTHAFTDRGNKLSSRGAQPEVIRSLIEIAMARGWDSVTVKGTDAFRRTAWMEAAHNGLKVAGYEPTAIDLAELAKRPNRNSIERSLVREKSSPTQQAGAETAQADPMKLSTTFQPPASEPQPPVHSLKADPELVKKATAFEDNKPAFVVKKYPDLSGAYGLVEAAKIFAAEKLPEVAREEFVGMARRHVVQKIMTGDAVKGPRIYVAQEKASERGEKTRGPKRQDFDSGKSPPTKEIGRER